MKMAWEGMDKTPGTRMMREELDKRQAVLSIEDLAHQYEQAVDEALNGKNSVSVRVQLSNFEKKVLSTKGYEQDEHLKNLVDALSIKHSSVFDRIPDDDRERKAFAFGLVQKYHQSIQ